MRSIVCRYETAEALGEALASRDRELTVVRRPRSQDTAPESVGRGAADGEWVLAIVEIESGRATAAAARVRRHGDHVALVFEPRDWDRMRALGHLESVPKTNRSPSAPPKPRSVPPISSWRKLGDGSARRILLVDDDTEVTQVLGAMLEAIGFVVAAARSGEDGLAMIERETFDLVVLDWVLPGMSGLDLCRTIRARNARIPVLFVTANATSRDVVEAFAGGADDYVVKPFRAPELGARIFGILRRVRDSGASP